MFGNLGIQELVILLIFFSLYFLPSIIGFKKKNFGAILVLNLLLGWTVIGWVVSLVWALSKDDQPVQVSTVIQNDKSDKFDKLSKLKSLFDNQAITEAEYNTEKEKILKG